MIDERDEEENIPPGIDAKETILEQNSVHTRESEYKVEKLPTKEEIMLRNVEDFKAAYGDHDIYEK